MKTKFLPEWPESNYRKIYDTKEYKELQRKNSSHNIYEIHTKNRSEHSVFLGQILIDIIEIENCIDVISLQLLTKSTKLKTDIYTCFYRDSGGISFMTKKDNLRYLIESKLKICDKFKDEITHLFKVLTKIIEFRNVLAHAFLKEDINIIDDNVSYNIISPRTKSTVIFDNEFKEELTAQIHVIKGFLYFLWSEVDSEINIKLNRTTFFYMIGKFDLDIFKYVGMTEEDEGIIHNSKWLRNEICGSNYGVFKYTKG